MFVTGIGNIFRQSDRYESSGYGGRQEKLSKSRNNGILEYSPHNSLLLKKTVEFVSGIVYSINRFITITEKESKDE